MIAVNDFSCVLMSMCREEVVTSRSGEILNFKPMGFLVSILFGSVSILQVQSFELISHVWDFIIKAGGIISFLAELV